MNQQLTAETRAASFSALEAWASAALAKLEQDPAEAFEHDVGYVVSVDAYHAAIKSILTGSLNRSYADPFHSEVLKPLRWGKWELTLRVDSGRRPEYGYFGLSDAGRPKCLRVQGFGLGGRIDHAIEWDTVDKLMADLLRSVAVTFEQACSCSGSDGRRQGSHAAR